MIKTSVERDVGPVRLKVESDSVDVDAGDLLKLLEERADELSRAISNASGLSSVGQIPPLPSDTPPTIAIMKILESPYGVRPRTLAEIHKALEKSSINYPLTSISSVLISLYKQGKLRRWKVDKRYVYSKGRGI